MLYEKILMGFDFEFVLSPQKRISSEPIQIDGSKVLDFRDEKFIESLGGTEFSDKLLKNRNQVDAYNLSNMTGHSAERNGYQVIILKSVPDIDIGNGYNIHIIGR